MIVVRLIGGLGNQMFQYALARRLAHKNGTNVVLDLSLLLDHSSKDPNAVHRDFELDIFDNVYNFADEKVVEYFNGRVRKNVFGKGLNWLRNKYISKHLIIEKFRTFSPEVLELKDNKCLVGSWQSPKYFDSIPDIIREDFTFKTELLDFKENNETLEKISSSFNAVSIHVRRGDYVSNSYYKDLLGILDVDYFKRGLKYIKERVESPTFFIFSDDIEWCKTQLGLDDEDVHFVVNERSKRGAASDMFLISSCQHNIISNSSFSWWGAWLNSNPEKIIYCPSSWVSEKYVNDPTLHAKDIIPNNQNWIKDSY